MKSFRFSNRFLIAQWVISASYSLLFSCLILFHKNIPEQSILSRNTIPRLLATVLPFSVFIVAVYYILRSINRSIDSNRIIEYIFNSVTRIVFARNFSFAALSLGLFGVYLPSYHFGEYSAYYTRIQPLLFWVGIFGLHLLIVILFPYRDEIFARFQKTRTENHGVINYSVWIFLSFMILWYIISKTGMGISKNEDFWYEVGVPILPAQILISALAGIRFGYIEKRWNATSSEKSDLWIFFGIWLIAALFWVLTPAPNSYMNPSPLPPNHEVYPYSDAAHYDLQSQHALNGQGFNHGKTVDNPLYPVFLVFIHLISGQNYTINMALQAAIFAVFPAIIYLLGKALLGRSLGIIAALMIAFHGYNSIAAGSLINLASPKQMMTDFPTAIGVALSVLTLIKWNHSGDENLSGAIWHGGTIGFTFLIRPTALALLAIAPIIKFVQSYPLQKWIKPIILVLTGFIIFVTPWGIRNMLIKGNGIDAYLSKVNLVRTGRFPEVTENKAEQESDNPTEKTQAKNGNRTTQYSEAIKIVLNHFTNNIIGSTLSLPTSPVFDDLQHTLRSPDTFWITFWNGKLSPRQTAALFVSLAILALGIATLWNRNKLTGLAPLMALLFYQLTNSIGRTSGGRFIAPTEWVIIFYFAAGIMGGYKIFFQSSNATTKYSPIKAFSSSKSIATALFLILILGAAPLGVEFPYFTRHAPITKENTPISPNSLNILSESNYSSDDITKFLDNENSILMAGRAMYPRYLSYRAITQFTEGGIKRVNFPHLEFYLIDPNGTHPVVLYKLSPDKLLNNTDVLVLGCKEKDKGYVDAIAVIITAPAVITHVRQTNPPLICPLQQPVCDNNGNCR